MTEHIIKNVIGWRIDDYDGYNDYYVEYPKGMIENELEEL